MFYWVSVCLLLSWSSIILSSKNTSSGLPGRQIGAPLITHHYYLPCSLISFSFSFPWSKSETDLLKKKKESLHGERNITNVITKLHFFFFFTDPFLFLWPISHSFHPLLLHLWIFSFCAFHHYLTLVRDGNTSALLLCEQVFPKQSSPRTMGLCPWWYLKTISTQHPSRKLVPWVQVVTPTPRTLPAHSSHSITVFILT